MELTDKKWKQFKLDSLFTKKTMKGYPKDEEDLTEVSDGYHVFGQNIRYQYPQRIKIKDEYLHTIDPQYPILAYTSSVGEIGMIEESFYRSGDNGAFQGLFPKSHRFNRAELLFILSVLQIRFKEYGYTTSMANVMDMEVPLPVDDNGNPDWAWIEQYMKSLEDGLDDQMNDIMEVADGDKNIIKVFADKVEIDDFKAWLQDNANMEADNQMSLDDVKWKEFLLDDYFDISAGTYYSAKEYEEGTTPYISASNQNNGISKYISLKPDFDGNCIITGKVGCTAFYQKDPFCATSDVNVFEPKFDMSPFVGLFVTTQINRSNNYKYDYVRQCRVGDSKKIRIYLPVDTNGNPDWAWIEQYMKSLPYSDKEVEVT